MGDSPETRPRYPIRCIVVVGILVALGAALAAYGVYRWSCSRRLEQVLNAARAQGFPVSLEELNVWYVEPPPGENAADVLVLAFERYVEASPALVEHLPLEGDAELPDRSEPLPEDMTKAIATHLQANVEALDLLRQGAAMSECRWPVDFTLGCFMDLPHVYELRCGARLLAIEAMYSAERGNSERATDALMADLGLARSLDKEPSLISQHSGRVSCLSITLTALDRVLNRTVLTDSQLERLGKTLREAEDTSGYVGGLAGDRCLAEDAVRNGRPLQNWLQEPADFLDAAKVFVLGDHERAELLDMYQAFIDAAEAPLDNRLDALHAASQVLSPGLDRAVLPKIAALPIMLMLKDELRIGARLRTARTALAIERYRLLHGQLPESLDDLVPEFLDEVPRDPFGDGPLKYKRLEKGYTVYSIGHDEEDDGGLEHDPEDPPREFFEVDLTFIVER
jgi:hypothetical protein